VPVKCSPSCSEADRGMILEPLFRRIVSARLPEEANFYPEKAEHVEDRMKGK
jgi:hypothetical protein